MSPAKATRPGFRNSMGVNSEGKADGGSIHLFHPVYHVFITPIRSRTDVDRIWPVHLDEVDEEELIDTFSEPPQFAERLAPVTVQFGDIFLKGHNWTELRIKILRHSLDLFGMIGRFMESTLQSGGNGARIPFTSLALDPDTIHRIVELDYESGEATYQQLITQISEGTIALSLTTPFHAILPLLSDIEVRLMARMSFIFYLRLMRKYHDFLKRHGEEGLFVVPFWIPEAAFQKRVADIINEEFAAFARENRLGQPHLVFLLDSDQAHYRENDVLMKSWNVLAHTHNGNGAPKGAAPKRNAKPGSSLHPAANGISVVFRDRTFSDWVVFANPSVKKLLDRTIAKVDSDLNSQGVHYGWAHFEDLDTLAHSPKSVQNLKQKLVKLAELGYVPLSPDFYVRGKLRGHLGYTDVEPQTVEVHENSAGTDWHPDSHLFSRWTGVKYQQPKGGGAASKTVLDNRKIKINHPDGVVDADAPQCWKIAWSKSRETCARAVIGDLEKCQGGMAEVLGNLVGGANVKKRSQNVMDFLANYTYVYWREHFIQHDLSEADINIHEMANEHLRNGLKQNLNERDAAIASAAAQAIFFALDSNRSTGTRYEHMDQRAFYQNVAMLTLAMCNSVYVWHWLKEPKKARKMVDLIKSELIGFESAYQRHGLADLGVKKKSWEEALQSQVADSRDNVVKRAARRVAACHLRQLGYTRDFSREDELTTTNCGHLWNDEITNLNYKYENPYFCGVREG